MKKFTKIIGATLAASSVVFAGNALAYQSNTGAGQTTQPSMQYQRQLAEQERQRKTYYYQPAPPARAPETKYIQHPSRIPGMTPVPVQLSPQDADAMGGCMSRGAGGSAWGWAEGGPRGAVVGFFKSCLSR